MNSSTDLDLSRLLVVDVESTCWLLKPPPDQESEIIEIGACMVHLDSGFVEGPTGRFVIPEKSDIGDFCTELTTITPEDVEREGISFAAACAWLQEALQSRSVPWASWGDYDKNMFRHQCESRGLPYPFSDAHANVRRIYGKYYKNRRCGMAEALRRLDLSIEGTHHRGVDDAYNIGRIIQRVVQDFGAEAVLERVTRDGG